MARINFTSQIEQLIGSLAGSTFQDSTFGLQIRTRVSPRNPRSTFQMLRRGEFAYITQLWRTLSTFDRDTWVTAAGTLPAALNLFVSSNINLSLINLPAIANYIPSAAPLAFPVVVSSYHPGILDILANGLPNIVPAGTTLLISATDTFSPSRAFISPSSYTPIVALFSGSNLSIPTDIITGWLARYGRMKLLEKLCLTSALINTANGLRSPSSYICAIQTVLTANTIIDAFGDELIDFDGTLITYP